MPVKLPPLLNPDRIKNSKKIESKKSAFDSLTQLLVKGQSEVSKHEVFDALVSREKLGSTYIGNGIAIPRAKLTITNPRAALLILNKGLAMNSADKIPVRFFLAILIPEKNHSKFSGMLKSLNSLISSREFLEKITTLENPKLLTQYFNELLINNE